MRDDLKMRRGKQIAQPTRTCLAIGPDEASKIDQIKGQLELL
ncbi:MAG: peptidyl-tRNA hydrolase [Pirellula sp.]